jgi:hypothetical protein
MPAPSYSLLGRDAESSANGVLNMFIFSLDRRCPPQYVLNTFKKEIE